MGYKYGVWYVYEKGTFPTKHIGHFTVTCFMEKEEAKKLYTELLEKFGSKNIVSVDSTNPVIFEKNIYKDDNNNICSWGYKGKILNWNGIQKICDKYSCNFSLIPHSSIEYSYNENDINPIKKASGELIDLELKLVDISSDDYLDWNIIG